MKKFLVACTAMVMMSSCAVVSSPATGFLYTGIKAPVTATSNGVSTKVGTAQIQTILGAVAVGDASIETAAKQAGIKKIHHVDYESKSYVACYGTYTVIVYGE